MESQLPEWLNKKFLEETLRKHNKNEGITLISFEVERTSANGEGFMGQIYRTKVVYAESEEIKNPSNVDLIIKAANEELKDVFTNFDIYKKEVEFYDKIVPKYNEKLKNLGERRLFAECFAVCKTRKIMVIEDLKAKGYNLLPGPYDCNLSETKAVLRRMALFNAIGAILQAEEPNVFVNFKNGHMSRDVDVYINIYVGLFDALLETISMLPELSIYHDKLSRFRKNLVESWRLTHDVKAEHFNALVHNDLWPPNVLVKGTNSSDVGPFGNILFIDFQNTFWGSPTVDLHVFLNTTVQETFLPQKFEELVEFYHSHLTQFLKQLKYKGRIPTWPEFYEQYEERKIVAFLITCMEPAIFIDNTGDVGIYDLLKNDEHGMEIKRKLYQKPKVQAILRKMIPYYDQIGTFD